VGLALSASLTDALSVKDKDPVTLQGEADAGIEPTNQANQAEHDRPDRRAPYQRHSDLGPDELEQHRQIYHMAGQLLDGSQNMSHSRHILQFIMSHSQAPVLPHGGCLYLPNDDVWSSFYQHVEHPFSPLFGEMIANSYYPGCSETSLSGLKLPSACGSDSMRGSRGCFSVNSLGSLSGVKVYETHGLVGLPDKWSYHIKHATPHHVKRSRGWEGKCARKLPEVPKAARLEIPTRYVVCRHSDEDNSITEEHVREQNRWANEAFSGKSPWQRMDFDSERPPSVDMQISFKLVNISIVTDTACAREGFSNTKLLHAYNTNAGDYHTVAIITRDQSGILGQTRFPQDLEEGDPNQMVIVSAEGFRGHAGRNHWDMTFDEGDTVVHESGHAFGLYHTFEGGCSTGDDFVDDTEPERLPHYSCSRDSSCSGGADPVHNFMDYSPDTCMVGFTEGQKRRAWCELQNHRAILYQQSLRTLPQ
jgi:hypothetical protein